MNISKSPSLFQRAKNWLNKSRNGVEGSTTNGEALRDDLSLSGATALCAAAGAALVTSVGAGLLGTAALTAGLLIAGAAVGAALAPGMQMAAGSLLGQENKEELIASGLLGGALGGAFGAAAAGLIGASPVGVGLVAAVGINKIVNDMGKAMAIPS